jgi:PhzF family phenazine biosynthesis protein
MQYFIVDAFAERLFTGNPAGICLLEDWPEDALMQSIAAENNLAETAFVVPHDGYYDLRWFTPEAEIDLCGHATLATAFVIANFVDTAAARMEFRTMSGVLTVTRAGELYEMDFPARTPTPIDVIPQMAEALGVPVLEAHLSRDMLFLVENEEAVRNLKPNLSLLAGIPNCFAAIVTAKGEGSGADFVSRFFAPSLGIPEDPVTGSAHSTLIPFWAERLGKDKMVAKQLSQRGGTLLCENRGERVKISGKAVLYLRGEIL